MNPHIKKILLAMRADAVSVGKYGLWEVVHHDYPRYLTFGYGFCTGLYHITEASLHLGHGEMVMIDHVIELRKHLEFILKASGNVLVTGLGLGCVIRGLGVNEKVDRITVIERDSTIIKIAGHLLPSNTKVIHGDALSWAKRNTEKFDFAWHDLWSNPDHKERCLQVNHAELMSMLKHNVGRQGAWAFPRYFKRKFPGYLV